MLSDRLYRNIVGEKKGVNSEQLSQLLSKAAAKGEFNEYLIKQVVRKEPLRALFDDDVVLLGARL